MVLPAASFIAALILYTVFAGDVSWTEAYAGIPAAAAIAAFVAVQHRGADRPLRLRPPLRILFGPIGALVTDTARVGAALLRALVSPVEGRVERLRFTPGGQTPGDAGRRAAVTLAASLTPNGFVLDLAPSALLHEEPVLLLHRLTPAKTPTDTDWPV